MLRGEQCHGRRKPIVLPRSNDNELLFDRTEDVLERQIVDEDPAPRQLPIKGEMIHISFWRTNAPPVPGDRWHPLVQTGPFVGSSLIW